MKRPLHLPCWSLSGRRTLPLGVVLALFMAACQSAMSVQEAQQVSTTMAGNAFVPPPRTLQDITAILRQQTRDNTQALERARTLADEAPPVTTDAMALSTFYEHRAWAAFELDRPRQHLEDLALALRSAALGDQRVRVLIDLADAESLSGNLAREIAYLRDARSVVRSDQRGWRIIVNSLLARRYALTGNIAAAEAALREAEQARAEAHGRGEQRPEAVANWDAQIAIAHGYIHGAQGRLKEAEQSQRDALQILATAPARALIRPTIVTIRDLALVLARQGRLLEAEVEARRALLLSLQKFGRTNPYSTFGASILALIVLEQGRFADAEALTREILAIQDAAGADPEAHAALAPRRILADALVAQGRWPEAVVELDKADAIREQNQTAETWLGPGRAQTPALALIKVGRAQEVVPRLERAVADATSRYGASDPQTAEIRGLLAMARAQQGDVDRALTDFAAAVPILLERAGGVEEEGVGWARADRRRTAILDAYIRVLIESQGRGTPTSRGDPIGDAFRLAEAARGRAVEAALSASSARSTAHAPALAGLIRQEQDAGKQISALTGALTNQLSLPTNEQDPAVVQTLRGQIATLTHARQALTDRIHREFPAYTQLVRPQPATVADVQVALRPGEALLSIYVDEDRTYVWAVPKQGPVAFATVMMGSGALEATVTALRRALDPNAKTLGEIPAFDLVRAHRLYQQLLEPVRPGWQAATSLVIVAHAPLGALPFALLPTAPSSLGAETASLFANYRAVPWLVRTHAVTVLPSVASLVTLWALPAGDATRRAFVGFGDPYFSTEQAKRAARQEPGSATQVAGIAEESLLPAAGGTVDVTARSRPMARRDLTLSQADSASLALLPQLPDTADEIRGIAAALHADMTRDVFLGIRATKAAVKTTDLGRYRVIAFATHGLVPGDLDGLTQPALALTAPEVAGGGGDGLLKMEDILTLRMNADWVVLSACNTASGQGAGAEAISGLGRAFFYAGARALLVSNWPVETTSARALTTELFRRQAANPSLSRAQALQQTLNALIDRGAYVDAQTKQTVFSYAHPIFWAPFSLVGDGGGPAGH